MWECEEEPNNKVKEINGLNERPNGLEAKNHRLETATSVWKCEEEPNDKVKESTNERKKETKNERKEKNELGQPVNYLHGLVRRRPLSAPLRQPANYVHGIARRFTKPFPLRQPANYIHGLASQPITSYIFSTIGVSRIPTANQNLHMHTITHKRVNNSDPGRQKVILGDKSDPGRQKLSWATKVILGDKIYPGRQKCSWATKVLLGHQLGSCENRIFC